MTERFKVSTKKSLHGPIEIEVDGKVYSRPLITVSLLQQVDAQEKKVKKGDFEALVAQIHLLTGIPKEIAKEIDLKDLEKMLDYIGAKLYGSKPKKAEAKKVTKTTVEKASAKNVSRPGPTQSS